MAIDEIKLTLKAGHGGAGRVSFMHDKLNMRGGPDGGDGGDGGNIFFLVDENYNTLERLANRKLIKAKGGSQGSTSKLRGKNGESVTIKVPPGTIIKDAVGKLTIKELNKHGEEFLIVKGGVGGKGNSKFKSATNRTPRYAEQGEPGEEREVILELKLIADIGLVGLPNAGKSSLIRQLSNATPRVAVYPFTTIGVHLGVLELADYRQVTIADIPGLIEGAHKGKGLGDKFLRHVERTKFLIHLVDISHEAMLPPIEAYNAIRAELDTKETLKAKKELIIGNKIDVKGSEEILEQFQKEIGKKIISISCLEGTGIKKLIKEISKVIDTP